MPGNDRGIDAVGRTGFSLRRRPRCGGGSWLKCKTFIDHRMRQNIAEQFHSITCACRPEIFLFLHQGSFVYTRDRLLSLKKEISAEISRLGGHVGLGRLIEGLDRQVEDLDLAASSSEKWRGDSRSDGTACAVLDSI